MGQRKIENEARLAEVEEFLEARAKPFAHLREILGLTREEIASWFPRVIAEKTPPQGPDKAALQAEIDAHREEIGKLKINIEGMSAAKRGREFLGNGEADPSYLDTATRNNFKAQDRRAIARHEKAIKECENGKRRKPRAIIDRSHWVLEVLLERDFTFADLFIFKNFGGEWKKGRPVGRHSWIEHYEAVTRLDEAERSDDPETENDVILYAIMLGFYNCSSPKIRKRYPWIFKESFPEFEREVDLSENALIEKTGGAQIGGQIQGAGWTFSASSGKFRPRGLSSFNLSDKPSDTSYVQDDGEETFENPEEYTPN